VLDVWALGEVVPHYSGPGTGFISLKVDKVLLPASALARIYPPVLSKIDPGILN
jgi:hypothetical protein